MYFVFRINTFIYIFLTFGLVKKPWYNRFISYKMQQSKEECTLDLQALLLDKKKKANENNKSFLKAAKGKANNTGHQMPMRKAGRGK